MLSDLTIEHMIKAEGHTSTKMSSSLKLSGKAPVVIVSSAKQKVMQHVVIDKKQHQQATLKLKTLPCCCNFCLRRLM